MSGCRCCASNPSPPHSGCTVNTVNAPLQRVRVWDLPTRLFHWLVVLLLLAAYITWRLNWMDWHVWIGEAVLTLVLFRILWGCFGSDTARFARFVASPRAAVQHLAHSLRREPDRQVGHNAAGSWMVLLLLALLLSEPLTGLFVNNEIANEGPLGELVPASVDNAVTALHAYLWDALLAAAALHIVAIALYALARGHNLVTPMFSGRKSLPADVASPRMAGAARAAVLLGCSALAVAALATFL
jgi:cytochrome b